MKEDVRVVIDIRVMRGEYGWEALGKSSTSMSGHIDLFDACSLAPLMHNCATKAIEEAEAKIKEEKTEEERRAEEAELPEFVQQDPPKIFDENEF